MLQITQVLPRNKAIPQPVSKQSWKCCIANCTADVPKPQQQISSTHPWGRWVQVYQRSEVHRTRVTGIASVERAMATEDRIRMECDRCEMKEDMHWDWNWFNLSGILNPCYDKICVCLLCILYCLDGTVFRRYSMEKVIRIILISLSVPKLFSNWPFGRYTPTLLHSSWFWVWNLATSRFWTPLSYLIKPVNFWVWIGTAKKFCCDKNTWGVVTNACHSGWMTEPTVWNVKTSFECVKASMMWSATLCFVRWMMVGA